MKEEFLHYLWRLSYFNHEDLQTTDAQRLEINRTGHYNTNAGPDFLQAQIKIDGMKWVGNAEIHIHSSDWDRHEHHKDPAYENVILHVVYRHDREVMTKDGRTIPTLELKGRIPAGVYQTYRQLSQTLDDIPCQGRWDEINELTITSMKERMIAERLHDKSIRLHQILKRNRGDWEQTAFEWIASYFGMTVNSQPFEQLARSIDVRWLYRLRRQPLQVESLLFGQAGWLNREFSDEYPNTLRDLYAVQRKKFSVEPLSTHQWKFSRMRPASFPTIRLAQFAQWCVDRQSLFQTVLNTTSRKSFHQWLDVQSSEYWRTHYRFDKQVEQTYHSPGTSWKDRMIINAFSPIIFLYGQKMKLRKYMDRASGLLFEIPPEDNKIIRRWSALGVGSKDAADSQALIKLYTDYCRKKRCLQCKIGHALMSSLPSRADEPEAFLYL